MITIMVILVSMAIAITLGSWIREVLPINAISLIIRATGICWNPKMVCKGMAEKQELCLK